jgi:flagellar biosynthesis protein FlhG
MMETHDSHELPVEALDGQRAARRIVAVGGGKGGAGKSLLAANVAIYLTTLGKRVVLLDADLGGANLHTFVGVERPRVTLGDLFEKRVAQLSDVVVETAVAGLGLVSGEGDPSWIANPRPAQKSRLLHQVQELPVDYLVVDLGPGSGINALDFFLLADVGLLVMVPEPTSVENTYRFVKSAFLRRLRRAGLDRALNLVREGDHAFEGGIPAPFDLYEAARRVDTELADKILTEMRAFRPRIVVNQVRSRGDIDLGPALVSAARRRLGVPMEFVGHIEHDDAVWLAVRKRRPLMIEEPQSRAAKCVAEIARRLIALEMDTPPIWKPPEDLTHYETLEVEPAATDEDIRRAYRRMRDVYGQDSLVVCGLWSRERLFALQARLDEAYETLMDAERRRAYDVALFPDGQPPRKRPPTDGSGPLAVPRDRTGPIAVEDLPAPEEKKPLPPEPLMGPDTPFTGGLLKQIREARGIDIHAIAQRTKVGVSHLRAIEEEHWANLPATVYVRGFLTEYARYLRLDAGRVTQGFLARMHAARADLDDR